MLPASGIDEHGILRIHSAQWAAKLFSVNASYRGAYGGRGSGKSHAFAEALLERHCAEKTDTICAREIQKSLKQSVKRLLELKIEALGIGSMFVVQDTKIICPYGGVIVFEGLQSHTSDSIKSFEAFDLCWIEEAQSVTQKSWDILRPTIRKPGSEIWATWNPNLPTDPIDAFFRSDDRHPNSIALEVNWHQNPWFPEKSRIDMEYDRRNAGKWSHIWGGAYAGNAEARVFNNWRVEEFEAPKDALHRFGGDWGFAVDPSVLIRCHIVGRKLYIDYEAYMVGCRIEALPALFLTVPESESYPITADSSRPETIDYMRRNGFAHIMAATKGAGSVEDGIEWLKNFDIIVHPRCVNTISELTHYKYKRDPLTDKVLPVLEDKNNHVIDALRYACEGARRAPKPRQTTRREPIRGSGAWMG